MYVLILTMCQDTTQYLLIKETIKIKNKDDSFTQVTNSPFSFGSEPRKHSLHGDPRSNPLPLPASTRSLFHSVLHHISTITHKSQCIWTALDPVRFFYKDRSAKYKTKYKTILDFWSICTDVNFWRKSQLQPSTTKY